MKESKKLKKSSREEQEVTILKHVNFDKFQLQKREVSVDGKKLPLQIGDKVMLSENDKTLKTVMAMTIFEDGRVSYMLEWHDSDSGQFSTEAVTLSELKLLSKSIVSHIKRAKTIGY